MALVHPALSTTGKSKRKFKFKNAQQAAEARQLANSWNELQQRWNCEPASRAKNKAAPLQYKLSTPTGRESTVRHESRDTGHTGALAAKAIPKYTGDNMIGIVVQHKSCLQPVFSKEAALESATMRRG